MSRFKRPRGIILHSLDYACTGFDYFWVLVGIGAIEHSYQVDECADPLRSVTLAFIVLRVLPLLYKLMVKTTGFIRDLITLAKRRQGASGFSNLSAA